MFTHFIAWGKKKIHFSWLFCGWLGGALFGIGLSIFFYINFLPLWLIFSLIILLVILSLKQRMIGFIFLMIFSGMLFGLWRGGIERADLTSYNDFLNQTVTLSGIVMEDPAFGASGDLQIKLKNCYIGDFDLPGVVWASIMTGDIEKVKRYDEVEINGKLKPGFANFPASFSFAKLNRIKRAKMNDLAGDVRDQFGSKLHKIIKKPESDLGMGILAGQKRALPNSLSETFKISGLTHIIVASGYNLTILVRFARRLFFRISRFAALAGSIFFIFGFASLTGFGPSMVRATIVATLSLLCWFVGRKIHPVILLISVAGATGIINPYFVWGDAGWYMSFAAFAGVIILSPLIQKYFFGDIEPVQTTRSKNITKKFLTHSKQVSQNLRAIIIDTLSASLLTLPIIAYFMGTIAPFGLIANVLVLPFVPLIMLLTFIAGAGAFFNLPLIALFAKIPESLLNYIIVVAEKVSEIPGALLEIKFSLIYLIIFYALLLGVIIYMWKISKFNFRNNYLVE